MEKKVFEGVITPMITPLLNRETLDIKGLEKMLDHLADGGVSGIFLMGTTGEGASLSYRMRRELIKKSCDYVAGRVPVLVGITDTCIEEALNLADYAYECGATYLVSALPYYLGLTQDEIVDFYSDELSDVFFSCITDSVETFSLGFHAFVGDDITLIEH